MNKKATAILEYIKDHGGASVADLYLGLSEPTEVTIKRYLSALLVVGAVTRTKVGDEWVYYTKEA
jgi:DeoR/GlpR family transcriptional regulator of sugar metabolism